MPAGIVPFNAASPVCTVNQCLQQVVGSIDNNPIAQFDACVSMFGSPSTYTVTLPADEIISTTTTTVPYTDIIVTLSTTELTHIVRSTSYAEVVETVTAYSATSINTVTEVVTAPTPGTQPTKKKRSPKKRGCNKTPTSSGPSTTSTPDASASTSTLDATSATSLTSEPAVTSSTSALYPIASNCASLEDYSSACSCINAVSSTATLTMSLPGVTDIVTVTESTAIPSTSTSVVTVIVSSTVIVPVTATATVTTTGLFKSTTTVTTTTTLVPPTQTAYLTLQGGPGTGKYVALSGHYVISGSGVVQADRFNLITAGGQPSLALNNDRKLFLHASSSRIGSLYVETDAQAASTNDKPIICKVNGDLVTCTEPSMGTTRLMQCGEYISMISADWNVASSCSVLAGFKMSV